MGVFIFFDCCDKNLIVLSRQLLIPLNSSKDDNSFVIIFLFFYSLLFKVKTCCYETGEHGNEAGFIHISFIADVYIK
jgi:hypothetical protein